MSTNEKVISQPNEVVTEVENFKKIYDNMTQDAKMSLITHITQKIDNDPELLNYFVTQLIENVGYTKTNNSIEKFTKKIIQDEPILNEDIRKFTAFPIQYQNIWKKYKEQMACFWKAEEIDFSNDYNDFMTLTDSEKYFVEM